MYKPLFLLVPIVALVGCTTYPKNYTYSPTVSVGGDNQGGIALPSPYAKKPQPVPEPQPVILPQPVQNNYYTYNTTPEPTWEPLYDETPLYIDIPNVHYKDRNGSWR